MPELAEELDARLQRLAVECGALSIVPPATVPREVLERCGHFESFPGMAIQAPADDSFHTPAACYHVYSTLEGRRLDEPHLVTLVATCGRNESFDSLALAHDRPAGEAEAGRLRYFRMREVVFVGSPAWVSQTRDEWMNRASAFATSLGLGGSFEPATDTFFGDPGRGRRLMQQLKTLKYELRMQAGAGVLAVASFNLHESFFTSRFEIKMSDGSPAASGCAAFGIERWVLACRAQRNACLR